MEMSLRLILLAVALIIISGILWDAIRSRKNKLSIWKQKKYENYQEEQDLSDNNELPDEIAPVKNSVKTENDSRKNPIFQTSSTMISSTPITVINRSGGNVEKRTQTLSLSTKNKISQPQRSTASQISEKADIFVLHVMSNPSVTFNGLDLKVVFDELHLKYGEMKIFHSHEHIDGSGDILFSVASAIEPGYFEIENLEALETPGLVLFFKHSNSNHAIAAFEWMLRTARQIAMRLNGQVLDHQRKPLSEATIEQYREQARNKVIAFEENE